MTIKPGRKPAIFYLPLQDGERKTDRAWRPFFRMLFENPRKVIAVTVLLSLVCVYPALQMRFDYNLMNLQARGLQSVEYAYKLMASRENSGYFTVIPTRDRNEALRLTERLERLPGVDHVVSMLTFVPDGQEAKLTELAELKRVMDEVRPVPYEENLRLMELPKVFESFRDRVDKLKSRWWPKERPRPSRWGASWLRWTVFFHAGEGKGQECPWYVARVPGRHVRRTARKTGHDEGELGCYANQRGGVPEQLRQRFEGKSGKLLLQVAPKKEIFERESLKEFVGQVKSVVPNATGEPIMVYESLTVLRDSYSKAFVYAFIGIAVILLINFKSVRFALIGTLPLAAGLLLMLGGMRLFGVSFNSANIIVLPLILGVGIDSAIYIINRYRQGNETPAQVVTRSAGIGVFLNALTILFSFGALMVAHHQGVFSIGAVMSLGMVASVAVFLVFLPALLTVWAKR